MARTSEDRSQFFRTLAEHPYLYLAAKKAGISPATIHRWIKSNPDFAAETYRIKSEGLANQNEKVEAVLVREALKGNMGAIKFYLPHNSDKYRPLRAVLPPIQTVPPEERKMYEEVYEWAVRNKPVPPELHQQIMGAWKRGGLIDENGEYTGEFADTFRQYTDDWKKWREERRR